ncbi:putative toxin-antitoxin system toxin component, PIN family [Desulfotomaculum copahuensis]|uniref:Putative toxin-antitoxin system toxin component, PIN family n=1 Tax=Desulfotomaculum copahuensis TaxID=1838280 RepID=A0A1B7LCF4_9FIRM|nr:putative toxin-antitoxin system toxin component, PIN family [Desulfotomaculum copahuensis]OAT80392.1 putative toxin-antitoxin system toxin component, PIN family [Desulfotomaculum copahuensis]
MKIVLDTNVVVSGILVSNGPPAKILDLWIENKFRVIISQALIEEYFDVLLRPKFRRAGTIIERQDILMGLLSLENTIIVFPGTELDVIKSDPEDNRVLECALAGEVQYIVSGDEHLLKLKVFQGIMIISPTDFVANLPQGM